MRRRIYPDGVSELWPDAARRDVALARITERMVGKGEPNRRCSSKRPDYADRHTLTPIERRVLEALSYGLGVRGTADALGLTYESVKYHAKIAARVLRAKNTTHACATALRQGVIR